jgi:hypothetical protein
LSSTTLPRLAYVDNLSQELTAAVEDVQGLAPGTKSSFSLRRSPSLGRSINFIASCCTSRRVAAALASLSLRRRSLRWSSARPSFRTRNTPSRGATRAAGMQRGEACHRVGAEREERLEPGEECHVEKCAPRARGGREKTGYRQKEVGFRALRRALDLKI